MANTIDVKNYIACWMQLGRSMWLQGGQQQRQVQQVLNGEQYSQEFEDCWQQVLAPDGGDCYLDGTTVTVNELMSPTWEIVDCARCHMPVALPTAGLPPVECPCQPLPNWPNTELPCPRPPVQTLDYLRSIQARLGRPTSCIDSVSQDN
jgi:hypothetical protein